MGYAKYHEDDFHIYCERIYTNSIIDSNKHKESMNHHRCPYCEILFDKKESMFSHIRYVHNILKPLLFINGIVVKNDDTVYVSEVKSAYVQMYDFDEIISINNEKIKTEAESDCVDITEIINKYISKDLKCTIDIGNNSYQIEKYSLYSVSQTALNTYVFEWNNSVLKGQPIKPFSSKANDVNEAELLYLKGIYNYFIACQAKQNDKTERYYESNSILKRFVPINSLGLCIQKIIAFKFNWVNTLADLCECYGTNDDFQSAICFFQNKNYEEAFAHYSEMHSIFMEDELKEIFDAIIAFNRKEYEYVKSYLCSHDAASVSDVNLKDKILLLQSRMSALIGNEKEAKFYFDQIRTDEFNNSFL